MQKIIFLFLMTFSAFSFAQEHLDLYSFTSPAHQERFFDLTHQFRCVVCQNQSLADSNAPLAVDMKKQILMMINQGENDQAITAFLKQRYGEFISYQPPFDKTTFLLWVGPFFLLIVSAIMIIRRICLGLYTKNS
jgi:cytochrome c-type biogenesis protein CcmH